jgi:hypothetical protein
MSTVSSAPDLDESVFEKSWQVLLTLGLLVTFILASIVTAYYADKHRKVQVLMEQKLTNQAQLLIDQNRVKRHSQIDDNAINDDNRMLMNLADEALPQILTSQKFSKKLWNEVKKHHRWIGVIFYFSDKFPRVLRVISLSTNILIMLFIQSLTYDLTKGDDGTCKQLESFDVCLEPRSGYATGESKCFWTWTNKSAGEGNCEFVQPSDSITVVVFIAIFSAVVSTPIALLCDWIIQNVLAAPDKDAIKETLISNASQSRKEMLSIMPEATNLVSPKERLSVLDDQQLMQIYQKVEKQLYHLKRGIKSYRAFLSLMNAEELKEFDGNILTSPIAPHVFNYYLSSLSLNHRCLGPH